MPLFRFIEAYNEPLEIVPKEKLIVIWVINVIIASTAIIISISHLLNMVNTREAALQESNKQITESNGELEQLVKEKNELMEIVSHDLKNPIGAVRLFAELIENQTFTGDEVLTASAQIAHTSDRMLALVKNVLDMNRLESGGVSMEQKQVHLAPMIEAVHWQYTSHAEAKKIQVHFSNETASSTTALADEQTMMQILDNLVSNAVKYSPHGKNIFIRLKSSPEAVRVEVEDEGPGISAEDMKKLFGKFARLSARPTGGEHSTGLGLSIVKKLVEAMNGKVWCESEYGHGATFIVELQQAPAQP